jgi:exoribonuclease-2
MLLALHAAPVYFHRKGKGRFRKAPADILAAALAGLEKKRQQALAIERMDRAS